MLPADSQSNVVAFIPSAYSVKPAEAAWETQQAHALRRQVFCHEQQLFHADDTDALDDHATIIVAMGWSHGIADQVVGTVRIHYHGDGLWYGSRLAVAKGYRGVAPLGSELIRVAVGTANARGCQRFLAQVQRRNVPLFRSLHWHTREHIELRGQPHRLMEADLDHYPPCDAHGRTVLLREGAA